MRGFDLLNALHLVDSNFVEGAEKAQKKKKTVWRKRTAIAASISAATIIGVAAWHMQDIPDPIPPVVEETDPVPETTPTTDVPEAETGNTTIGGISRNYKDIPVVSTELSIEWSWDYKTTAEKFTELTVNGIQYSSSGRFVDPAKLDKSIGAYETVGYNYHTDTEHRFTAEVYSITGISKNSMVAVELEGQYVIFKDRSYNPPSTFGELLDEYSLAENLPFHRFTVYKEHTDTGYFSLEDDWEIWQILNGCRDAVYVEDNFHGNDGEYLSFTATSDALGVYKKVFYVTDDGYVKTNVFEYGYSYDIGEEAAKKIMAYAKENSTAAVMEPYTNSLTGTLVGITDEYILADDTFLCTEENAGMIFRIPANDLRISRCMENIDIGDVVVVNFTGNIDEAAGNVVKGAYSISKGYIINGDVAVLE